MPSALTYPGVYVEEVPSGVRTVVGVATSVTAFLGRAFRGPASGPGISVFSFDEFERIFGGLSIDYPLTFAVRDYFLNGGSQAVIVRLTHQDADATKSSASAAVSSLTGITASSPGTWGNNLWIQSLTKVPDPQGELRKRYDKNAKDKKDPKEQADLYDLTIVERIQLYVKQTVPIFQVLRVEKLSNVVLLKGSASSRRIDRILSRESRLLTATNEALIADATKIQVIPEADPTGRQVALAAAPAIATAVAAVKEKYAKTEEKHLDVYLNAATRGVVAAILAGKRADEYASAAAVVVTAIADVKTTYPKLTGENLDIVLDAASRGAIAATRNKKTESQVAADAAAVAKAAADAISADPPKDAEVAVQSALTAALPTDPPPGRTYTGGLDGDVLKAADYKFNDRLDRVDIFNLMCLPPDTIEGQIDPQTTLLTQALQYCVDRRAMLILDPPTTWGTEGSDQAPIVQTPADKLTELNLTGQETRNAAVYFPRVKQSNPLRDGAVEAFVPCGIVAGRMAATDVSRGVWKAPAGIDAAVGGTVGLGYELTDEEHGKLNPLGINCLRSFPIYGRVIWGSRTLRGADAFADEYKYVPVRRLALYIEESLFRGTKWVVHEPNGEVLWSQIRANVGAFMQNLFLNGALAGTSPQQAYYVNCDKSTNPDNFVNLGIVTIKVGFAPLRPAEFVVIQLSQIVGTSS